MKKFMLTLKENKKVKRITVSAISVFLAVVLIAASVTVVNYRKNKVDVGAGTESAATETPIESTTETVTDATPETTAPAEIEESTTAAQSEENTTETVSGTSNNKSGSGKTNANSGNGSNKQGSSSGSSNKGNSSSGSNKTTTTTNPWSDIHFLSYDEVKWAVDEAIKYAKSQGCYIDTTKTTDGQYIDGKWSTSVGYRTGTDTATAIAWGNCRTKEGFLQSIKWDIDDIVEAGKKADEDHRKQAELEPDVFTYEPREYWAHINVYLAYGDALTRHGLDTKNADGSTRYIVYIVY